MKRRSIIMMLVMLLAAAMMAVTMASCGGGSGSGDSSSGDAADKRHAAAETVLKTTIEFPDGDLYNPQMTYIGDGVPEADPEQIEKEAADEKERWNKAIGDLFADGMFETFYGHFERTEFLGTAFVNNLTTEVRNIEFTDQDSDDTLEYADVTFTATDTDGNTQEFTSKWQIQFDSNDPALLQQVRLEDDGSFLTAYTDAYNQ